MKDYFLIVKINNPVVSIYEVSSMSLLHPEPKFIVVIAKLLLCID